MGRRVLNKLNTDMRVPITKFLPKSGYHAQRAILFGALTLFFSGVLMNLSERLRQKNCFLVVICKSEELNSVFKLDFVNLLFVIGAVTGSLHMIWGTLYYVFSCFGMKLGRPNNVRRRIHRENPVYTIFGTGSKCRPANSNHELDLPRYTELVEIEQQHGHLARQ